jgi:hypothetical protein
MPFLSQQVIYYYYSFCNYNEYNENGKTTATAFMWEDCNKDWKIGEDVTLNTSVAVGAGIRITVSPLQFCPLVSA